MSSPRLEAFLARLYTDDETRARFLDNPREETTRAGLTAEEAAALNGIDRVGLQMAATSYAWKREQHRRSR